jgi:hypothetical protein
MQELLMGRKVSPAAAQDSYRGGHHVDCGGLPALGGLRLSPV